MALNASSDSPSSDDTLPYMIDAATAGALILSDDDPSAKRSFEPEEEFVIYHSPDDLIEKVRWLLDAPAKLESIAAAGTARALRDHSLGARMTALDSEIRKRLCV
jgi:spore maturation protein CgeB